MRPGEDHLGGFLSCPSLLSAGYHTSRGPRRVGTVHSELVTSVRYELILYLAGWLARSCSGGSDPLLLRRLPAGRDAFFVGRYVGVDNLTVYDNPKNLAFNGETGLMFVWANYLE
jgi:hypothetical protein